MMSYYSDLVARINADVVRVLRHIRGEVVYLEFSAGLVPPLLPSKGKPAPRISYSIRQAGCSLPLASESVSVYSYGLTRRARAEKAVKIAKEVAGHYQKNPRFHVGLEEHLT